MGELSVSLSLVDDNLFDTVLRGVTKHVTPEMLLTHLAASGWTFRQFLLNDHAQEWVLDGDDALSVIVPLPSLPHANDFTRRMHTAIKFMALMEGWPFMASVALPAELRAEVAEGTDGDE